MALIVFDGFDHYAGQADLQSRDGALQWDNIALIGASSVALAPGRGGFGQAVEFTNDQGVQFGGAFADALTTGTLGFALILFPQRVPYADIRLMNYAPNNVQMTFRLYTYSGVIQAFSGDADAATPALLATSGANAFSAYIWNFVEIGVTIGATGSYDLHINGTSVLSGSGVVTNAGDGSTVFNGVAFTVPRPNTNGFTGVSGVVFALDDFYLCDSTTGPGTYPCNGFMGDVAVRTLFPTANQSVQWTPLANQNWQEVSEVQFDGDESYNSSTSVGATDLFTFGALPTTASVVFGVQLTGAYRKQDASEQTIVQEVVSGGSTLTGAPQGMSLSYSYLTTLAVVDPGTETTWTPTAVNAFAGGYELSS